MKSRIGKMGLALLMAGSLGLSGCQSNPTRTEQSDQSTASSGAVAGALIGALIGVASGDSDKAVKYAAIGAVAGGALGYFGPKLYRSLAQDDRERHDDVRERALRQVPDGDALTWENPDSLSGGSVTVLNSYMDRSGTECKEIEETIVVEGESETVVTNLCKDDRDRYRVPVG